MVGLIWEPHGKIKMFTLCVFKKVEVVFKSLTFTLYSQKIFDEPIHKYSRVKQLLLDFKGVYEQKIGILKWIEAQVQLKLGAMSKFKNSRRSLYALLPICS